MNKGFTLIELLVVIAVLGAMLGLTIPSFISFTQNQFLKQGLEQVQSDLRAAQSRSQSGVTNSSGASVCWGMRIPCTTNCGLINCPSYFETGYNDCGAGVFVVVNTAKLPGGVTAPTGGTITFGRITGQPISAADITLDLNGVAKHIIVEAGGNMYVQ